MQPEENKSKVIQEKVETFIKETDIKIRKKIQKLSEERLREVGLRKYWNFKKDCFNGNPNKERRDLISQIINEASIEISKKRMHLFNK